MERINGPMLPIGRKVVPLSYDCGVWWRAQGSVFSVEGKMGGV